jgi:hypothetical protein
MKFIVFSTFLILASSTDSLAARRDNRQERQQGRIHQGVKSGELTKRDAQDRGGAPTPASGGSPASDSGALE